MKMLWTILRQKIKRVTSILFEKSLTGGLNPTDIHHYDEIREVVLRQIKFVPPNFCVLSQKLTQLLAFLTT